MKKTIALLALLLVPISSIFAGTYYGTITETITSTTYSQYHVGEVFTGFYQYDSATLNGEFRTPLSAALAPANGILTGGLFLPSPSGGNVTLVTNQFNSGLQVVGGVVVGFNYAFVSGGNLRDVTFIYSSTINSFLIHEAVGGTQGTLSFSAPVLQTSPVTVPDEANVAGLLALPLLVVAAARRRTALLGFFRRV